MKKDVSKFRPFGCKAYVHLKRRGERKENIHLMQWKQFTLDSLPIAIRVRTSFIFPRPENALYQIKPDSTRSHSLTGIRA